MDRLYVRGLHNVHKKLLIQAAACNLARLMRSLYGAGKPKAAHDRRDELVSAILSLYSALTALCRPVLAFSVSGIQTNSAMLWSLENRHPLK